MSGGVVVMLSNALLTVACAFGATVWLMMAHVGRKGHAWRSVLYTLMGGAYSAVGMLLAFRLAGRPILPNTIVTVTLLTIVFAVPPATVLIEWIQARKLIKLPPDQHETTVAEDLQEVRELIKDE